MLHKENWYALYIAICGGKDRKGMSGEDALIYMKLKAPTSRNFTGRTYKKKGDSKDGKRNT